MERGPRAPAEPAVARMFDAVARRYDAVNRILSLGLDGYWRRETARAVAGAPAGWSLDVGCGTGRLARELGASRRVAAIDLSEEMLRVAARSTPAARVALVRASALGLPFADASFASVASAFVLRNLDDLPAAFREMARVTRPGGRAAFLDIVPPRGRLLRRGFEAYFSRAAPAIGRVVGRADAYRYLVRSLRHLPGVDAVAAMLAEAGFDTIRHRMLFPGPVTLWTARRP